MKAGLFMCDHVKAEYQSEFGNYPDMFIQMFPEFQWNLYDVYNNHFPEDLDENDVYFATGSFHSVYENIDWLNRLKQIIKDIHDQKRYYVGFCFGHQLMAESLDGKVEKSANGWCVGVHEFDIVTKMDWIQPLQNSVNLLMMCQDQVVKLPENSIVLTGNKKCPIGMFQVGEKMLGIQAHPEFPKSYNKLLIELRANILGEDMVREGLKSLKQDIHPEVIHDWVLNFLKY